MSLLGVGLVAICGWVIYRTLGDDGGGNVDDASSSGPKTTSGEPLVPQTKEGLFEDYPFPVPSFTSAWNWNPSSWNPFLGSAPSPDLDFGGIGNWGLGDIVPPELRGAAPLSAGDTIVRYGVGAIAPMVVGERVTFGLSRGGSSSSVLLEGVYDGPSVPSAANATVYVDRIAHLGDAVPPALGKYTIPSSSTSGSHDRLQRVAWSAIPPEEAGLDAFPAEVIPALEKGNKITVVARDGNFNVGAFVASVISDTESGIEAALLYPVKTLHDEGRGALVPPKLISQATVHLNASMLVDPSSLTPKV